MDRDLNIFQNLEVDINVKGGPTNIHGLLGSYDCVILKPNKKGSKNVLEQWMMSTPHTKYVIKYDFNLQDTIIEVPADCIIEIDCGSLQHGTLKGNNTVLLNTNDVDNALVDIVLQGTWKESLEEQTAKIVDKITKHKIYLTGNTLTQDMINTSDTIYVIKDDLTLETDITIPANCILEFDGGSISGNNILTGTNTSFKYAYKGCALVKLAGTFVGDFAHIGWFNDNNSDIADNIQILINNYNTIIIDKGTWYISKTVILRSDISIIGEDKDDSIIKAAASSFALNYCLLSTVEIGNVNYTAAMPTWPQLDTDEILYNNIVIKNITFDLNRYPSQIQDISLAGVVCINYENARNCVVDNCRFLDHLTMASYNYTSAIHIVKSVYCVVGNCCSEKSTLINEYSGSDNLYKNNKGVQSPGTWIETTYSKRPNIINNNIEDTFAGVSIIGINSEESSIIGNYIHQTGNFATTNFSGLTISHPSVSGKRCKVENNTILMDVNGHGILNQDGSNIEIRRNYIHVVHSSKSESSWNDLRYSGEGAIVNLDISCENLIIDNNILISDNTHGVATRSRRACVIRNNKINARAGGINCYDYSGTSEDVIDIENNIINPCIYGLHVWGNAYVKGNIMKGGCQLNSKDGKITFIDNTIDFTDYTHNIAALGYCCVMFVTKYILPFIKGNRILGIGTDFNTRTIFLINISDYAGSTEGLNDTECKENYYEATATGLDYLRVNNGSADVLKVKAAEKNMYYNHAGASRPTLLSYNIGYSYFDTTLGKPIYWNGTAWVDATGATV